MSASYIQKIIDETNYYDMQLLDLSASFFGDEIRMYIKHDELNCWMYKFVMVYKAFYETDAGWGNWRNQPVQYVSRMKISQLGYYGQDISVCESDYNGFYQVKTDLSIMNMEIICKDINVDKVKIADVGFFWKGNC